MKLPFLALVVSASAAAFAADSNSGGYHVRSFGAVGDGRHLDTAAINRAIDAAAAAGGGIVNIPAGEYLCYSVHLRSHVTLDLAPGATLIAADPPPAGSSGGYDAPEPNAHPEFQDFGHSHWHNSLIWGENLEDVSIIGAGRIFGRGLSRGNGRIARPLGTKYPATPGTPPDVLSGDGPVDAAPRPDLNPGPFGYPNARDALPDGVGNKSIALKNCRNVTLRDFTILHGGHFGILATGVDNLTIDNLRIDTNRDGMDIDACHNVRISNCSVNSPWDDGICVKASYGLGVFRTTENVTIANCFVSGYDEGTLLDGTRQRNDVRHGGPIGRIKLGTEATGGFRGIAISNCVFEYCRGLALEEVDGAAMEDIAVSNLVMRDIVNAPIFIRLGARQRGPEAKNIGTARQITISNLIASNVAPDQGIFIAGLPGHPIENLMLDNVQVSYRGGGTSAQAERAVPELENGYPEPENFGVLPSWGLFLRHAAGVSLRNVHLQTLNPDLRPAVWAGDVADLDVDTVRLKNSGSTRTWSQSEITHLRAHNATGLTDTPNP